MKILTKREMYFKFHAGEFGNRTATWPTYHEWYMQLYMGLYKSGLIHKKVKYALRYMEKPGGPCTYNLTPEEVITEYKKWRIAGYQDQYIQVSEMIDDNIIILAGEVKQTTDCYDLFYYRAPAPMREGLTKYGQHLIGPCVAIVLGNIMDEPSIKNLWHLFNLYPDAVIEFTCCSRSVGILGWNTVTWEVRDY